MRGFRLLVLPAILSACTLLSGGSADPRTAIQREIAAHEQAWHALAVTTYDFTVDRSCFCLPGGPFRVTVVDGVTTAVTVEGKPVQPAALSGIPLTIDAAFALLRSQPATASIKITWHVSGFPAEADVDPIPNAIDDEFTLTIKDVVVPD